MKSFYRVLVVALLIGCFLVLIVSHSTAELIIKFLLGKVAYSTSNGAALYVLTVVVAGVTITELNRSVTPFSKFSLYLFPVVLSAGFVLHALGLTYYFLHFNLPFGPYFFHWQNGVNSYTSPFHSHIGKVAIDFMVQMVTSDTMKHGYDTGRVFRGVMGNGFAFVVAFCFVLGNIAAIGALPTVKRRYSEQKGIIYLYLFCSAVVLKNVLDGGFLAQPAPVAFVVLFFIIGSKNSDMLKHYIERYWWGGLLIIFLAELPKVIFSGEQLFPNLTDLLIGLALVVFVLTVSLSQKHTKLTWVSLGYLLVTITVDSVFNLLPLLCPTGQQIGLYNVDTARKMQILPDGNLAQLYYKLGDSPYKSRWLLVEKPKQYGGRELLFFVYPLELVGKKGIVKLTPTFVDFAMNSVPQHPDWIRLNVRVRDDLPPARIEGVGDIVSRNNAYVYMHAVARMLTEGGFSEFIMMPITSTSPAPLSFM